MIYNFNLYFIRRSKSMNFLDPFKEFFDLDTRKKELETELKQINEKMQTIEPTLIELLEANDMSKISIGDKMCYINPRRFAMISSQSEAVKILKEAGYNDFISESYNTNSISKLCRDLVDEHGDLPEEFGEIIKLGEVAKLNVKAA
jgi:hypothetical protein